MKVINEEGLPKEIVDWAIAEAALECPNRKLQQIKLRQVSPYEIGYTPVYLPVPFERVRRITGYLTGSTAAWNAAKQAELRDRVSHM